MQPYNKPVMLYFGSPSCHKCIVSLSAISGIISLNENNFKFVNGDDFENEETQKLCDDHNVDEYPHVKIFLLGEVIYEKIGDLNIQEVVDNMLEYSHHLEAISKKRKQYESKYSTEEGNRS